METTISHRNFFLEITYKFKKKTVLLTEQVSVIETSCYNKKSRIWETPNLSTDADSRTNTILERLRDLSQKKKEKNERWRY